MRGPFRGIAEAEWLRVLVRSCPAADIAGSASDFRFVPILLQKSKVASVRIFGETFNHEAIDDSDNLSRATEVAYEFCVRL